MSYKKYKVDYGQSDHIESLLIILLCLASLGAIIGVALI